MYAIVAAMGASVADALIALGLNQRGVLVRAARAGRITAVECAIPGCERPADFDPISTSPTGWSPTIDHFPRLKRSGGTHRLDNVRLAHKLCNWEDSLSRVLAENVVELLRRDGAIKLLECLYSPERRRTITLEQPMPNDLAARLRLIEALEVELSVPGPRPAQ